MFKSKFLQECEKRGFIYQCTNIEELDKQLCGKKPVVAYWGTDPTGASLHVGHLFSLMMIKLFQKCGNKPIIVVGGATAMIGDPSGKDKSRPMMTREALERNKIGIKKSLEKFIKFGDGKTDAILVDNYDWWKDKNYIDVLREIGPHMSVNRMLSFESIKQRLAKTEHLSFLEFNYMVFQSYDFYHLYKTYGCTTQLCGGDQWGNVVAGVELIRRLQFIKQEVKQGESTEVFGLSSPLLLDANGKKLGKSEGNAVWTNEEFLEPFKYFQYFRNVDDRDVEKLLKAYTELEVEEIAEICKKDINEAKKILAFEATKICHGEKIAQECLERAKKIFEHGSIEDLEKLEYNIVGDSIVNMLKNLNVVASNGEARRLIQGGGVKIDDKKIDENYKLTKNDFKLSIGKKKFFRIIVK